MSIQDKIHIHYNESKKVNAHIMRKVAIYALAIHILLIVIFAHIGAQVLAIANIFSVIIWAIGLVLLSKKPVLAFYLFCAEVTVHSILVCSLLGMQLGFQFYLWTVACLLALIIDFKFQFKTALFAGCAWVIVFASLYLFFAHVKYAYDYGEYLHFVHWINIIIAGFPMVYIVTMVRKAAISQRIELTKHASLDYLTQLCNRRFSHNWLAKKQTQLSESSNSHFIVIADIDFFKRINDNYGHNMGDKVLQHTAQTIQNVVDNNEIAARWGGEEFLFTVTASQQQHAFDKVEQLRHLIAAQKFCDTEPNLQITMSFGMANWLANSSLEHTLHKADKALYSSKNSGRNKTTVAS